MGKQTYSLHHWNWSASHWYWIHNILKISYQKNRPSILDKLQLGELDELLDSENVNGLSSPPLGPHNHQFSRDDNCIKEGSNSAALPIFIFILAQLFIGS